MKYIIFSISLFIALSQGFAQVVSVVNEGFETWPGAGWSSYAQAAGNGWVRSWQNVNVAAHTGSHSAYAQINNNTCDHWLVSPAVDVANSNYVLTFWERFDDVAFYVSSTVHISTGSDDPADGDFQLLFTQSDTSGTWIQRNINLAAYAGDTVYLAFRYQGTWHTWFVDDVFIGPNSFVDAGLTTMINPRGISTTTGIENVTVKLENTGTLVIDTLDIDWKVNGQTQTSYSNQNMNLNPGDSLNITLGTYNFNSPGGYMIESVVTTPLDANTGNDTLRNLYQISTLKDAHLLGVDPESYVEYTGLQDIQISIENNGGNLIDSVSVSWTVDGTAQTSFSAAGLGLQPGQSQQLTIGQYNFSRGIYTLDVQLDVLGDTNTVNNSYRAYTAVDTLWESFEGRAFPPRNWDLRFGVRDNINFDFPPHGNYYYSAMPDSNFFGTVADTLFTPYLNITSGDSLRFRIKTSAFLAANQRIIAQDLNGNFQVLTMVSPLPDVWQAAGVDLSAAVGVKRIGFVTYSNGPGFTKYDLISSDARPFIANFDLSLVDPEVYFLARKGLVEDFECQVANVGLLTVAGSSYSVKLMDAAGTQLASMPGLSLSPGQRHTFTLSHSFGNISHEELFLEVDYAMDQFPANNVSRTTDLYVVPAPTILSSVGQPDYADLNFPFTPNGNTQSLGEDDLSQTHYSNTDLPIPGNIYGFIYHYDNYLQSSQIKHIPLKVWISQTQVSDLSGGWVPGNQLALVFDDTVEVLPGFGKEMYIPFDNPISYTGLDNLVIQDYAYDPEWPPSILRFYSSSQPNPGPVKTIAVMDYYALDPANPPAFYAMHNNFVQTTFVLEPVVDSGLVQGTVYGTGNIPLPGATVSVNGTSTQVQTDGNGDYVLPYLPQNTYNLTASVLGYNDSTQVVLLDTSALTVDFHLLERQQVTLIGKVSGDNAPSIPLEDVKVTAIGYTVDSAYSSVQGIFALGNIFGISDYELTFSLYGYHDTTFTVSVVDSNINIGNIILHQEFISPMDVHAIPLGSTYELKWRNPLTTRKVKLQNDRGDCSYSYTNSPMENVWLGNLFEIHDTTTLTSVEIHTDVYDLVSDSVRIDIFDQNEEIIASSEWFLIYKDSLMLIDIPNIVVYGDIYAMLHWENNDSSTHALCIDFSDSTMENTAVIKYPNQPIGLFTDFIGGNAPSMAFLVRVNSLDHGPNATRREDLQYNVYRGLASEFPYTQTWKQVNSSPISAESLVDNSWTQADPSGRYRYGVEVIYNLGNSNYTFSQEVEVNNTTAILDPQDFAGTLQLYPVPAREVLNLRLELDKAIEVGVTLINPLGQELSFTLLEKHQSFHYQMPVAHLPAGVYILQLDLEGKMLTKRIIIGK